MKKILMNIYHLMFNYYFTFRINVFLINTGIEKNIAYYCRDFWVELKDNRNELRERNAFYEQNKDIIANNLRLLSDEESRYIYMEAIKYRCNKKRMKQDSFSLNNQYFVDKIITLSDDEVFVDCGAYVGDSVLRFINECKKKGVKYKRIIAIEPENKNFLILNKFLKNINDISFVKAGVGKKSGTIYLSGQGSEAHISEYHQKEVINIVSLDSLEECKDATYIKMDIEGAEWDALHGAETLIRDQRPKLAVCIYHSDDDMVRLIGYIHELNPKYKLYIRHHSRGVTETVLYAI